MYVRKRIAMQNGGVWRQNRIGTSASTKHEDSIPNPRLEDVRVELTTASTDGRKREVCKYQWLY